VVEAQGGHRLQVDRPANAAHQVSLAGLVDRHPADERGGILVVLGVPVVARGGLLDAVERAHDEVRIEAANGDLLVAAVFTLAGQACQPHKVVGDADVGQLADILGGDDLDDRVRILLELGRHLKAARVGSVHRVLIQDDGLVAGRGRLAGRRGCRGCDCRLGAAGLRLGGGRRRTRRLGERRQ